MFNLLFSVTNNESNIGILWLPSYLPALIACVHILVAMLCQIGLQNAADIGQNIDIIENIE